MEEENTTTKNLGEFFVSYKIPVYSIYIYMNTLEKKINTCTRGKLRLIFGTTMSTVHQVRGGGGHATTVVRGERNTKLRIWRENKITSPQAGHIQRLWAILG